MAQNPIHQIANDTRLLREQLVEKVPGHFDMRHVISAWLGSLFFGFTFVLKGLLLEIGLRLDNIHLALLVIATLTIISAEIYFVGYARVPDKQKRRFFQFWIKRISAYYGIAIFTSFLLLSVYGITTFIPDPKLIFKLVIAISFPAGVGAAAGDLLKRY